MELDHLQRIEGGVVAARGFRAAGIHAGFRKNPQRLDMALVVADELCPAAGVFTQNVFCSAPVTVSREHLDGIGCGVARAVVINSGNANAATGEVGLDRARAGARLASEVLGCAEEDVLVCSTGVIGVQLPLEPYGRALPALVDQAGDSVRDGRSAARAIMTTDTHDKQHAVSYICGSGPHAGARITVGGMAKGSGMIMPNMATMIGVITTDAPLSPAAAHHALTTAADRTFNKVTVDSDTSTNDTALLFASGKAVAGAGTFEIGSAEYDEFVQALLLVCENLARQMAADGEGATKLVTVNVRGAADDADADEVARSIANSPLVKTAIYGHDANWGRIAAAAGKTKATFRQEGVDIAIMGIPVCRKGLALDFDENEALRRFEEPEVVIDVGLGAGDASTTVWTCDFTHEYITTNGDYRT